MLVLRISTRGGEGVAGDGSGSGTISSGAEVGDVGAAVGAGAVSAPGEADGSPVCSPQAAADSIISSMASMTAIAFSLIVITP